MAETEPRKTCWQSDCEADQREGWNNCDDHPRGEAYDYILRAVKRQMLAGIDQDEARDWCRTVLDRTRLM